MEEEIHTLNSRASKYRRERETYKEMVEGLQKNRPPSRGPGGGGGNSDKDKINELGPEVNKHEKFSLCCGRM